MGNKQGQKSPGPAPSAHSKDLLLLLRLEKEGVWEAGQVDTHSRLGKGQGGSGRAKREEPDSGEAC